MSAAKHILPGLIFMISIAAGVVYLAAGDWKRGGYWLAAAAITFFVTV